MDTHLNVPFVWGKVKCDATNHLKQMMADLFHACPKIGFSINGSDADRSNLSDSEGVVEHLKKWIGLGKNYSFHDLAKLSEVVDEELPGLEMGATILSRRPQRNVYNWLTDPLLVGPGLSRFIREKGVSGHRYYLFGLARLIAYIAYKQARQLNPSRDVLVGGVAYIWTKNDHEENFYSYKTPGEKKKEKEKREPVETEEETIHTPVPTASRPEGVTSTDVERFESMLKSIKSSDELVVLSKLLMERQVELQAEINEEEVTHTPVQVLWQLAI
jgi:hypothetical protein